MTQIEFYSNAADKVAAACRLTARIAAEGARVLVFTPDGPTTERIDRLLWTQPAIAFVPHCRAHDRLAAVTPVIVDHLAEEPAHHEVLLNLHPAWPPFFSRFQRLIEIVGADAEDKRLGRDRYRFYRDRGYEIRHHDIGGGL